MNYATPLSEGNTAEVRKALCRLARFGANIADAHTCCILLPSILLEDRRADQNTRAVELVGAHSLCNDLVAEAIIGADTGLIGWVARHRRAIHVSPFEHDSRVLGIYSRDQKLKSFIGIPIPLLALDSTPEGTLGGVLACDSRKSFAFSKLQGKLLEDLAREVSFTTQLLLCRKERSSADGEWRNFNDRTMALLAAIGPGSVETLRLKPLNLADLEVQLGPLQAVTLYDQVCRLISQSLGSHSTFFRYPGGDLLLAVDNLMSGFLENKIRALCQHVAIDGLTVEFSFTRGSFAAQRGAGALSVEKAAADTALKQIQAPSSGKEASGKEVRQYEYRRA